MIRGFFDLSYRPPLPKVLAGLVLPYRSETLVPIEFVVDTGASVTCLHPRDARQRLRFTSEAFRELPRMTREDHSLTGITGSATYYATSARYVLVDDQAAPLVIDAEIRIAPPSAGNQELPSILGWDILERFRIVLDRSTGDVLLQ
jgi:hypothetical protein